MAETTGNGTTHVVEQEGGVPSRPNPTSVGTQSAVQGLSSQEAAARLSQYGRNAIPEERPNFIRLWLGKFWGPIPWMLEATAALQLWLHRPEQALTVGALLVLNAIVSVFQEGRAKNALAALRNRLAAHARVRRDGQWKRLPVEELVPGDLVRLRMGDIVPADLTTISGHALADTSALTGESVPTEIGPNDALYAGAVMRRGEVDAVVQATGLQTRFGRTAKLVQEARTQSNLGRMILGIIRALLILDGILVAAILAYALVRGISVIEVIPFSLILLVASVPVALPATFTLAGALGSLELARRGIVTSRLSAIEEAAAMDVLCSDKTGTLTQNQLTVSDIWAAANHTEEEVLRCAAWASDPATQDPLDLAVFKKWGVASVEGRLSFTPFDPATKRSEATVHWQGQAWRVFKGAPGVLSALCGVTQPAAEVHRLASKGARVLAIAVGQEARPMELIGLIGFYDPPREDSRQVVERLTNLGVQVRMLTGDGPETAQAVAREIGLPGRVCPKENLDDAEGCDVFAGIFPEDKFRLVQRLQQNGHVVGMTGDGVNDAPALKQAEVGIAVDSATDVAKVAASLVLTHPGLEGVLGIVEEGRRIYQRMLTYTLNKIVKTLQITILLGAGFMLTGQFLTTPRLVLLLLFANDFVTMSLTSDNVGFSSTPDRWRVKSLVTISGVIAAFWLVFSFGVFYAGKDWLHLGLHQNQVLMFLTLLYTGQATVYLVRERGHLWQSRPSRWLLWSSVGDLVIVSLMAATGVLMQRLSVGVILGLMAATVAYTFLLDWLKVRIAARALDAAV